MLQKDAGLTGQVQQVDPLLFAQVEIPGLEMYAAASYK